MIAGWIVAAIAFLVLIAFGALAVRIVHDAEAEAAALRQENEELRKRCAAGDWARFCLAAREGDASPSVRGA